MQKRKNGPKDTVITKEHPQSPTAVRKSDSQLQNRGTQTSCQWSCQISRKTEMGKVKIELIGRKWAGMCSNGQWYNSSGRLGKAWMAEHMTEGLMSPLSAHWVTARTGQIQMSFGFSPCSIFPRHSDCLCAYRISVHHPSYMSPLNDALVQKKRYMWLSKCLGQL